MANRFWVGGAGTWDSSTTTPWSTTTGGGGGASVPGVSDTAIFDGNSGSGTITTNYGPSITALTLDTGFAGTVAFGASTFTTSGAVTLTAGTLDTAGFSCSWGSVAWGVGTKTLSLGASIITLTGTTTVWGSSTANTTFNAGTSSITCNANASITFAGNGLTFNNLSITGSGTATMSGANTFNDLTRTSTVSGSQALVIQSNITVNGVLTFTGTYTATNAVRIVIAPSVFSSTVTQRTITVNGSYSFTNVDFHCILAAGSASLPWTGTSIGDGGNNSNITADTPRTLYWFGNATNWSTLNRWFTLTGGAGTSTTVPLPQDSCNIDLNSAVGASGTFNTGMRFMGRNVDFTGVPNAATLTFALGGFNPAITGSLTWASGMTLSSSSVAGITNWYDTRDVTLTNAGTTGDANWRYTSVGTGSITLADDLNIGNSYTHNQGTFNSNNKNISLSAFTAAQSVTRVINMGSGTWTLSGTGTIWTISGTGMTLNANTSTIAITDTSVAGKTFAGFSLTYNNITVSGGGSGAVAFTNNTTWNTITLGAPKTYTLTANTTQTVSAFNATGTAGNIITINSATPGTRATISKAAGTVSCDYLALTDNAATGGAQFYAGGNSTLSNTTGWIAGPPPFSFTKAPTVMVVR